jgi:hypothetical protein
MNVIKNYIKLITNYFRAHQILVAIMFLFIIGISIYANSFSNQMFWDDNDGILNNAYVKTLK